MSELILSDISNKVKKLNININNFNELIETPYDYEDYIIEYPICKYCKNEFKECEYKLDSIPEANDNIRKTNGHISFLLHQIVRYSISLSRFIFRIHKKKNNHIMRIQLCKRVKIILKDIITNLLEIDDRTDDLYNSFEIHNVKAIPKNKYCNTCKKNITKYIYNDDHIKKVCTITDISLGSEKFINIGYNIINSLRNDIIVLKERIIDDYITRDKMDK